MTWSRRQAVAALASSALAPLASGLLGCAAPARTRRSASNAGLADFDAVAAEARARVADLRGRVPGAAMDVAHRRVVRSTVDATGRTLDVLIVEGAVLSSTAADGRRIEVGTADTTREGLGRAAQLLVEQARASGFEATATPDGKRDKRDAGEHIEAAEEVALHGDNADVGAAAVADRADDLFARSRNAGGSRIVYRGAQVEVEDARGVHVGPRGERRQRIVRGLADVLLIASAGARSYADRARSSALGALEQLDIRGSDIEAAADNALALLMSRSLSPRAAQLLLTPDVAALLARDAVARRFASKNGSDAPVKGDLLGSPLVTIIDRPRAPDYGQIAFDDRGDESTEATLIDRGRAGAALGVQRRASPTGPARREVTNLVWPPDGEQTGEQLVAGIDGGLVLEGALDAMLDPTEDRITLRAARGREVRGGQRTGRLFGPILARASLRALLGAVNAVSATSRTFAGRRDGLAVSVSAPFVRTRGEVTGG